MRNPFARAFGQGIDSIGGPGGYDNMGMRTGMSPMKSALAARFLAQMCGDAGGGGAAAVSRGQVIRPGFRPPAAIGPAVPMGAGISMADQFELARGDMVLIGLDTGTTTIAAGATAVITSSPQETCLPVRMIVTDSTANNFVCTDLKVGNRSLLATVGVAIPMAFFQRDAQTAELRSFPIAPGTDLSITVTNVTAAPLRFTAGLEARSLAGLGSGGLASLLYPGWGAA